MRSRLIALVVLARLALPALAADVGEQRITPLDPAVEQRVEAVNGAGEQRVEPLSAEQLQKIGASAPKGPIRRGAEKVGKVALGVFALGVSLGFTAASLLFF